MARNEPKRRREQAGSSEAPASEVSSWVAREPPKRRRKRAVNLETSAQETSAEEASAQETSDQETSAEETSARDTFSDLLWMPHIEHRVSLASAESQDMVTAKHRTREIQYVNHPLMEKYLMNLGLYQMAMMPQSNIDAALIGGLVERWRPETHSFHFPIGEMTVSLQDVSALWGLRIKGLPIGGLAEDPTYVPMIQKLLGVPAHKLQKRRKDKFSKENFSQYCLSLNLLREHFVLNPIDKDSDKEKVESYTRAFVMDLFGSVMFTDSSGDSVPIMYLSLLHELENPPEWNWGSAVLAHLYHNLCRACKVKKKQIAGPLLLLQLWSWSHLPVCRPLPSKVSPLWGSPNLITCPAYGAIWGKSHDYKDTGKGKTVGISYVRNQLQMLHVGNIDWFPYKDLYELKLLSQSTLDQQDMWRYRGPLICFWIVEYHYPDRVTRQFGIEPFIPASPSLGKEETIRLHKINHKKRLDWRFVHKDYYDKARDPGSLKYRESGPGDITLLRYQCWFEGVGMASVYLEGEWGAALHQRLRSDDSLTYLPTGPFHARVVLRAIKGVAHALVAMKTPGHRCAGICLLKICAATVEDAGFGGRLVRMLSDADENTDWRKIPDVELEGIPGKFPVAPPEDEENEREFHKWLFNNRGWNGYYKSMSHDLEASCSRSLSSTVSTWESWAQREISPSPTYLSTWDDDPCGSTAEQEISGEYSEPEDNEEDQGARDGTQCIGDTQPGCGCGREPSVEYTSPSHALHRSRAIKPRLRFTLSGKKKRPK